jgi:hypothetical protein
MKARLVLLVGLFLFCFSLFSFSLEIINPVFPFKAFVYKSVHVQTAADRAGVTVSKETPYIYEFTYQGKKYKAELFVYGAIYLEREGQNPLLISFDIRDFRLYGRGSLID